MVHIWRIPESYPAEGIGEYDRIVSPDRFMFTQAQSIELSCAMPTIRFSVTKTKLEAYDCLPNSTMVPLLSPQASKDLSELCAGEVELIPTNVIAADGLLRGYSLLNATFMVPAVDFKTSQFSTIPGTNSIMSFRKLQLIPACLGKHKIARAKEYKPFLLVSSEIVELFKLKHYSGADFSTQHEIL